MARRFRLLLIFIYLAGLLAFVGPQTISAIAPTLEIVNLQNRLNYPLSIDFGATLRPSVQVGPKTKAVLMYRLNTATRNRSLPAQFNRKADNTIDVKVNLEARDFVFTGERVSYRWLLTFDDGSSATTFDQELLYFDNRFEWHDAERGLHKIHWYNGDLNYVDEIVKIAENQRAKLKQRLGLNSSDKYDLWFYDRQDPMTQVFQDPEIRNFLGVAAPTQGVAVILFPPIKAGSSRYINNTSTLEHEVTHLVLYSHVGRAMPSWFDEGFATFLTEPHFDVLKGIVNKAAGTDKFISLSTLSSENFYGLNLDLAYAEASSLIGYISALHGDAKLSEIIEQFKKNRSTPFRQILNTALTTTLDQLERDWLGWLKDGTLPALNAATPTSAAEPSATVIRIPATIAPILIETAVPAPTTPAPTTAAATTNAVATQTVPASVVAVGPLPPTKATPQANNAPASQTKVGLRQSNGLGVNNLLPLFAIFGVLILVLSIGLVVTLVQRTRDR